jgi:hypothetical protein
MRCAVFFFSSDCVQRFNLGALDLGHGLGNTYVHQFIYVVQSWVPSSGLCFPGIECEKECPRQWEWLGPESNGRVCTLYRYRHNERRCALCATEPSSPSSILAEVLHLLRDGMSIRRRRNKKRSISLVLGRGPEPFSPVSILGEILSSWMDCIS